MATKTAEGVSETLKYQTWTLKVPIHCRGCERKVKRTLHGIIGVFTTRVDSSLHKVTVTGDVDVETLIKKLVRSGKQAELWPEENEKKPGKSKKKDGEDNKDSSKEGGNGEAAKGKVDEKSEKPADNGNANDSKDGDDGGDNSSPETDEKAGQAKPATGGGGGGKNKKKNKNKNKKGQNENAGVCNDASTGSQPPIVHADPVPVAWASSNIPPPDHIYDAFPPPQARYYGPAMYGVSYNSVNPSTGTSYFCSSPMQHCSFLYSHQVGSSYPPPDPIKTYHDAYDDHYYDEDDEVGCSIM